MQANAADEDDAPDALDIADEDEVLFRRMRMRQLAYLILVTDTTDGVCVNIFCPV